MKHLLSFIFLFLLYGFAAQAQFPIIGSSSSFEEPETGYAKILFLKNKHTAYVHVSYEGAIEVKMYDAAYKPVFFKTLHTQFGKLKKMSVKNLFETHGNLNLFFSEVDGDGQRLCRVVIDGKDGHINREDVVGTMEKISTGKKYAIAMGGVDMPDFFVRHHAAGNSYAVTIYNSFASESDHRIEIILFNGDHQEVFRSYVGTPDHQYKYINMLDMTLSGEEQAQAWIYGFNTQKNEGGEAFIATLDASAKTLSFKPFYQDVGRKSTEGVLRYDAVNKRLIGVTQAISHAKGSWNGTNVFYEIRRFVFDPALGAATEQPVTGLNLLDRQTKALFGNKADFEGVLQNFYINSDGSQTLIFEGLRQETTSRGTHTSIRISMRNASVITYDKDGEVLTTAVIPFCHMLNNSMMTGGAYETYSPLEHYRRTAGGIKLKAGNQYKSFFYLNGKHENYVLLNDIFINEERQTKGKDIVMIQGLEECDAFVFHADGKEEVPKRSYLFGATDSKKKHNLALLTLSDYNREESVYATLRIDVEGKKKTARLVWMKVE